MDSFPETMNRLKRALGVSKDQEVAEALGLSKTAFSERKKRGSFPDRELRALVGRRPDLGIDADYVLMGVREDLPHPVPPDAASGAPASSAQAVDWSAYIQVPHYGVHASAGNGSVVHEEGVVDHLVFKRDWVVRSMGLDPKALALIDVRGDSMSPTINDGDLILLDTRPGQQTTEGIYAINLADGLLVKRLRLRLSGTVEVISDNARYGTETISGEQLTQLHVVGRVVWQGRKI